MPFRRSDKPQLSLPSYKHINPQCGAFCRNSPQWQRCIPWHLRNCRRTGNNRCQQIYLLCAVQYGKSAVLPPRYLPNHCCHRPVRPYGNCRSPRRCRSHQSPQKLHRAGADVSHPPCRWHLGEVLSFSPERQGSCIWADKWLHA